MLLLHVANATIRKLSTGNPPAVQPPSSPRSHLFKVLPMSQITSPERRQLTGWPCRSAHLWTGRLMDSHQYPLNMLLGVYCGRLCWRIVISRELGSGYNVQHAFSFTCSASNSVETYFSKRSLNVDACTKLAKPHNEDRRTDRQTAAPLFQPEPFNPCSCI